MRPAFLSRRQLSWFGGGGGISAAAISDKARVLTHLRQDPLRSGVERQAPRLGPSNSLRNAWDIILNRDKLSPVLEYLVTGRARRELFRLVWGRDVVGSVSELSRLANVAFSAAHRELDAMREAGLARVERVGAELVYQAESGHPHAELLRQLATSSGNGGGMTSAGREEQVRAWQCHSYETLR